MMNMCINFPDIIKITVWSTFLSQKFPIRIKHQVKIEFLNGIQKITVKQLIVILKKNKRRSVQFIDIKIINRNYLLVPEDSVDDGIKF